MKILSYVTNLRYLLLPCLFIATPLHASTPDFEEIADAIEKLAWNLEDLRSEVDTSQYEANPLVDKLAFDEEEVVNFVTSKIRFEPYRGVLRGASGALSARSGNALDQSLLLLQLLEVTGMDAQLLVHESPPEELLAALAQAALTANVTPDSPVKDLETFKRKVEAFAAEHDRELADDWLPAAESYKPDSVVMESAKRLQQLITSEEEMIDFGPYYWVRYRMGPGTSWKYAHPALAGFEPEELEPESVMTGAVPEEYVHYLKVELEAEILEAGELRIEPMMNPYKQPVASLFGEPLILAMNASGSSGESQIGAYFTPLLNDSQPPGAKLVTLTGQVLDAGLFTIDSSAQSMAGLFVGLGDHLIGATGAVSGRDADQPPLALTAVVMRVTWISPGGKERVEERRLMDRLVNRGADDDSPRIDLSITPTDAVDKLSFSRDILVNPGGVHGALLYNASLSSLGTRMYIQSRALRAMDLEDMSIDAHAIPVKKRLHNPFLTSALPLFDQPVSWPDDHHVFRQGPLILSLHKQIGPKNDPVIYYDIIMNPWQGVKKHEKGLESWLEGAVVRGIMDTRVEVALINDDPSQDYVARLKKTDALKLISIDSGLDELNQLERMAAAYDLSQGFAIAAIDGGEDDPYRWWRINQETGETLGRGVLGGQATTERIGISEVWLVMSWNNGMMKCGATSGSARELACCAIYTTVTAAGTYGAGNFIMSLMGPIYGATAAIVELSINAGMEVTSQKIDASGTACGWM